MTTKSLIRPSLFKVFKDARPIISCILAIVFSIYNCHYEKIGKEIVCIDEEVADFDIPESWCLCRMSTIANIYTGNSINETEKQRKYVGLCDGYNYIATKDVSFEHAINYENGVKIPYSESNFRIAYKNTPLLCIEGGSAGRKIAILEQDVCFGNKLCAFQSLGVNPKYLYYYLQNPLFIQVFKSKTTGIIGGVSVNTLKTLIFALPPLTEQERIVKKIERFEPLLAEYDKLEQQATKLDVEIYDKLRKSILQYAIQGKLVEQDENDEPASALLERIRAGKKAQLGKKYVESYIYKGDDNCYYEHIGGKDVNITEEIPFDLPENWCWVRLGEIITFQGGYAYKSPEYVEKSNYQLIRLGNVKNNNLILDNKQVFLSETIAEITQDYKIRENDILITMTGTRGKRDYFFSVLITEKDLKKREIFLNQRVGCLRANKNICVTFLLTALQSEIIKDMIFAKETGTANQGNIGLEDVKNYILIPIPPLAEQKRIVDKINEIFSKL